MPHFLDTNILLYSISRNPADALKRERAIALLGREDCALSVQALQEFYVQATRAARPRPSPHETAGGLLTAWPRFKIQELTLSSLTRARQRAAVPGLRLWAR